MVCLLRCSSNGTIQYSKVSTITCDLWFCVLSSFQVEVHSGRETNVRKNKVVGLKCLSEWMWHRGQRKEQEVLASIHPTWAAICSKHSLETADPLSALTQDEHSSARRLQISVIGTVAAANTLFVFTVRTVLFFTSADQRRRSVVFSNQLARPRPLVSRFLELFLFQMEVTLVSCCNYSYLFYLDTETPEA